MTEQAQTDELLDETQAPVRTTLNDRIRAVEREIKLRKRVYPRWVDGGKMTQKQADWQIKLMEDTLETLVRLRFTTDV